MRFQESYRRSFTLLLTIWFALVSGGVSLTHAHSILQKPCQKQHSPLTLSDEQTHLHRHLVLFGIEWPYELPPDSSNGHSGQTVCVLLVDVKCYKDCLTDTFFQVDCDSIGLVTIVDPRLFIFPVPADSTSDSLSPFAQHKVSGVLRF
jgi:hypothetical protein